MLPHHCKTVLECIKTKGIGPKRFWDIYKAQKNNIDATKKWIASNNFEIPCVNAIIAKHERSNVETLCFCQKDYPEAFRQIKNPPPILFYRGNIHLIHTPLIAIVGARNASYAGQKLAFSMAQQLSERYQMTVISGLAKGIDTSAHKGSVDYGSVAVIAQGLDIVYPKENEQLYRELLEKGGLILTELEMGIPPNAFSFPVRNRIIAALATGLVIIEAAIQSGTLTTAKAGLEFNKEIFVVPGSPFDPRYKGSHQLIKDGAYLIEDATDVIQHLKLAPHASFKEASVAETSQAQTPPPSSHIWFHSMIINDPISLEELTLSSGIPAHLIAPQLTQFELEGKIKKRSDGRFLRLI